MLTLYFAPGSSAMAPHIMLHEIGAPFESRHLSFARNQHKDPAYLAINPEGKVPTLLIERNSSTVNEPRAVSIDDESLRTMQAIGLDAEVLSQVVQGYGAHYYSPSGRQEATEKLAVLVVDLGALVLQEVVLQAAARAALVVVAGRAAAAAVAGGGRHSVT